MRTFPLVRTGVEVNAHVRRHLAGIAGAGGPVHLKYFPVNDFGDGIREWLCPLHPAAVWMPKHLDREAQRQFLNDDGGTHRLRLREGLYDLPAAFHELDRIRLAAKADRVFGELVDFSPVSSAVGDDRHESAPHFGNTVTCDFRTDLEIRMVG